MAFSRFALTLYLCSGLVPFLGPQSVLAAPWDGPEPTPAGDAPLAGVVGMSPRPTQKPLQRRAGFGLFERQLDIFRTCGFIDGDISLSLTCGPGLVCATYSSLPIAGCCEPLSLGQCTLATGCVPAAQMSQCNSACMSDAYIAKCTDSASPYCLNWIYDYMTETYTEYGCYIEATTATVLLTYSGQIGSPSFSFQEITRPSSSATESSTPSATDPPNEDGGGTPVGGIVGGVVGGLAVLGALAFGIVFLVLRSRRKARANAAAADPAAAAMMPPQPSPNDYKQPGMMVQQDPNPYFPDPRQSGYMGAYGGDPNNLQPQQQYPGQPIAQGMPYSPSTSPAPQYSPGQTHPAPVINQLDSHEIPQHQQPPSGANGQRLHEAP